MKRIFINSFILLFSLNSWAAGLIYPNEQLATIPKEQLDSSKQNPARARDQSRKFIVNYLKSYNEEFRKLNKIDSDVTTKKFEDIVMLNFDKTSDEDIIKNSQKDIYKIKEWLDFEAYQVYNKFYLTSKKAYELNLQNPNPTVTQAFNLVQNPVKYDSQILELNSRIKELSDHFGRVLEKAESLENQNKVLKNEIELSQKKINNFENSLGSIANQPAVVQTVAEPNKNHNIVYIILGVVLGVVLIYLFGRRGKD